MWEIFIYLLCCCFDIHYYSAIFPGAPVFHALFSLSGIAQFEIRLCLGWQNRIDLFSAMLHPWCYGFLGYGSGFLLFCFFFFSPSVIHKFWKIPLLLNGRCADKTADCWYSYDFLVRHRPVCCMKWLTVPGSYGQFPFAHHTYQHVLLFKHTLRFLTVLDFVWFVLVSVLTELLFCRLW